MRLNFVALCNYENFSTTKTDVLILSVHAKEETLQALDTSQYNQFRNTGNWRSAYCMLIKQLLRNQLQYRTDLLPFTCNSFGPIFARFTIVSFTTDAVADLWVPQTRLAPVTCCFVCFSGLLGAGWQDISHLFFLFCCFVRVQNRSGGTIFGRQNWSPRTGY